MTDLKEPFRSLWVFIAKSYVTDVKLIVKFKKKSFLSFGPLTASFDLFLAYQRLFSRFFGFEPKNMQIDDILCDIHSSNFSSQMQLFT
jgi:hypothetical protein